MTIEFKGKYGTVEYCEHSMIFYAYRNGGSDENSKGVEFCQFIMTNEEFLSMIDTFATDRARKMFTVAWKELNGARTELEEMLVRSSNLLKMLDRFESMIEAEEKPKNEGE
jgi:hypothetical protein